ncbi:gamma-glutamylcyclotransferase family protein [Actinomycetospora chiangmaiensis]|uniref:gamma-glutamylcyclotransferase family protein n=1 Tax=Actinomycetospora chiangmaiensis TaxID=402650 RepID=UPI00037E5637|nr:gamma-glutamylcyclotransferase family protein [Actinomycetospora chiangmaiensis]
MEGSEGIAGHPDHEYPAAPYPGVAPGFSFLHDDGLTHEIVPDDGCRGGWRVASDAVDDRLDVPLAARVPVLAYGSNSCPSKITWLRRELGLPGPVVALRVTVHGVAAVWAAGLRVRDDARPATLAVTSTDSNASLRAPSARTSTSSAGRRLDADGVGFLASSASSDALLAPEVHHVWLATPEQVAVLDRCEGRGTRYDLAWLHAATVVDERGVRLDPVLAYWPAPRRPGEEPRTDRSPLLVDGAPVRVRDVAQADARHLVGVPGPVPHGAATVVATGCPDPRLWPDRVFVYGTLQPGASAWWRLAPHARASAPAVGTGQVYDTGRGYPALVAGPGTVHGHVVTLADPGRALPALDAYEGPDYRRERVVVYREANDAERSADGSATASSTGSPVAVEAWAWLWDTAPPPAWPTVTGSWSDA